jgi:hypothetical protein
MSCHPIGSELCSAQNSVQGNELSINRNSRSVIPLENGFTGYQPIDSSCQPAKFILILSSMSGINGMHGLGGFILTTLARKACLCRHAAGSRSFPVSKCIFVHTPRINPTQKVRKLGSLQVCTDLAMYRSASVSFGSLRPVSQLSA